MPEASMAPESSTDTIVELATVVAPRRKASLQARQSVNRHGHIELV